MNAAWSNHEFIKGHLPQFFFVFLQQIKSIYHRQFMVLWVLHQDSNSLRVIHHIELITNLLEEVNPACLEIEHQLEERVLAHLFFCVCTVNTNFLCSVCHKQED